MKKFLISTLALVAASAALAKLPALGDEAKSKAAMATAKTAWVAKVDSYQLCKLQDKVAIFYLKSAKAAVQAGKSVSATPACTDPGAFVYVPS